MHKLLLSPLTLAPLSLVAGCTTLLDFGGDTSSDAAVPDSRSSSESDAGPDCGDGLLQVGEGCDDGNRDALDGCAANCSVEDGYQCDDTEPSGCTTLPFCPATAIAGPTELPASCKAYLEAGYLASGSYVIDVDGEGSRQPFSVLCDMVTAGGGWTVVVNNAAEAVEPDGCLPRLGSVDSFACGTPSCTEDFVAPAHGMPFTQLAWVTHDDALVLAAHHLFVWATPQSIPNSANWSLTPQQTGLHLSGLEGQPLIECESATLPNGLRRIANENVRMASGGFAITDVVTIFDRDNDADTGGNMSLTDVDSVGLDDFQDGGGCSDLWSPKASRGAATLLMIR